MKKPGMYTRINGTLCRVIQRGIMFLYYPVDGIYATCKKVSRNGWRCTKQFGLEEVIDLADPYYPTQKETDEALKPFGGRVPFNQEAMMF